MTSTGRTPRTPPPSSLKAGHPLGMSGLVGGDGGAGVQPQAEVETSDVVVAHIAAVTARPLDAFDQIIRGVDAQGRPLPETVELQQIRAKARRKRRLATAITLLLAVVLMVVGGIMVRNGLKGETVEEMPLPKETFAVSPWDSMEIAEKAAAQQPEPPAGLADMGPNQVWVPQIKNARTTVVPEDEFVPSRYSGLPTLRVPSDPRKAVWYKPGGAMWGADEGTTLVAAHVATRSNPGVFRGIDALKAGDVVWTTDADNNYQAWAVTQLWAAEHRAFPQDYFASDGPRQLVITTCGGRLNAQGYYAQNVFAVAVPVTVPGSTPYEPVTPEEQQGEQQEEPQEEPAQSPEDATGESEG